MLEKGAFHALYSCSPCQCKTKPSGISINIDLLVPIHIEKIIYNAQQKIAVAFLIENKQLLTKNLDKYLTSIDVIEARSGFDLL